MANSSTYGFSIRSFGSWGEAQQNERIASVIVGFSIRSFGSWGEAWRFVGDSGSGSSFSIRSFGSWGEAKPLIYNLLGELAFQYPLFRIVG